MVTTLSYNSANVTQTKHIKLCLQHKYRSECILEGHFAALVVIVRFNNLTHFLRPLWFLSSLSILAEGLDGLSPTDFLTTFSS